MLAGTALLGLSGGFLTAAALAGAAGLGQGFILQRSIIANFDEDAYLATVRELLPH